MMLPLSLIAGCTLVPLACTNAKSMLMRLVVPAVTLRRKMSWTAFVSLATRSLACDANATRSPFALMTGEVLEPFAGAAPESSDRSSVELVRRSRR